MRDEVLKHIKNTYLKRIDAPVGVEPTLRCWMELNDGMTDCREQLRSDPDVPVSLSGSCATSSTGRSTTDDFEDLTFDYTPEELGIDPANAAKIEEIKRLRPLSTSQPWGIFFVKFEPKRLPVVALRRILSGVALKKRASANSRGSRRLGGRRSALHLELRRGRRAPDQLRALLSGPEAATTFRR